ncbi:MAG: hypothetical protein ABIU95_01850 [Burkholderiales bacterium]
MSADCVVDKLLKGGIERYELDAEVGDIWVWCQFDSADLYHAAVCSSERDPDSCAALDFVVRGCLYTCAGDGQINDRGALGPC